MLLLSLYAELEAKKSGVCGGGGGGVGGNSFKIRLSFLGELKTKDFS